MLLLCLFFCYVILFFCVLLLLIVLSVNVQDIVVENGEICWQDIGEFVVLFGVNYSVLFVYGYCVIECCGIDYKVVIDMDVVYIVCLKFDVYCIYVWDKVISDK